MSVEASITNRLPREVTEISPTVTSPVAPVTVAETTVTTTMESAQSAVAQSDDDKDNTTTIIIIAAIVVFAILALLGLFFGFMIERKRSKEKMKYFKEMLKEESRAERKRKMRKKMRKKNMRAKKKKEEFAKSMKVMKAKQQEGIRKALEDYLAAQTQTMTVEDSERVVEMPSQSPSHTTQSAKTSESFQKSSISATTSVASTPVPRNLGQMPMEKL